MAGEAQQAGLWGQDTVQVGTFWGVLNVLLDWVLLLWWVQDTVQEGVITREAM